MLNKIHTSIRGGLFVFGLVFIASLAAVALSFMYLDNVNQQENKAKRSANVWKNKIALAKDNNQKIIIYEKPYRSLIENNIVGKENRLSWFETLQSTASSRGLETFRFSTASQVKVKPKNLSPAYKGINIYKSIMTLDMKISHEGDLFSVFNDLESNAKGLYSINNCTIASSTNKRAAADEVATELKASCELSWHSIRVDDNES